MTATLVCLMIMLGLHLLTPHWWWVMAVPFAFGAAAARTGGTAFLTGLSSAGLLWLGASLYLFLTGSERIAARMAAMFGLGSSWMMVLATAIVAALSAAVAGYAGYAVRKLVKPAGK